MSRASTSEALPTLDWGFVQAFAAQWHPLPTHAKILHAMAASRGLLVMHSDHETLPRLGADMRGWLWIGTDDTFRRCGLFKGSVNWSFQGWGATETGEGLRVNLLRVDHGGENLVYACHQAYAPVGRRSCARFVTMAEQDAGYQVWRRRVLEPIEGLTTGDDQGGEHA